MKKDNKKVMSKRTNSNTKTKKDKNTSQNNLNNKKKYSKSTKSNTISSNISKEKNSIPKEKEIRKHNVKKENNKSSVKNIKPSSSRVEKNAKLYKENENKKVGKKNHKSKDKNINNKKNNKILKIYKYIYIILFIIILGIGFIIYKNSISSVELREIIIELGNDISRDINAYLIKDIKNKKKKDYKLDLSNVLLEDNKTIKTGEYEYKVIYKDKEYKNKIIVKDTIKPELILNNVIITEGEELNIDMFIKACADLNNCKYEYKDEEYVNSIINEVGKYDIEIIGYDDSNNNVTNKTTLEILEKPTSKKVYAYGNGGTGKGVPVLNYHFTINNEEVPICSPSSICMKEELFDAHIKYIKENNIKALTMKEFEDYLDGKIELEGKSVLITIDDGWFVSRAITILEKYDVTATLFLIGSLADPSAYNSKNLEIHSHGWDLHDPGMCSVGRGGGILCYDKSKLLEDLKKSRESLNNTTAFCYPFYEYNDFAINTLKQSGFTMAFTGGNTHAKRGVDKFKIPRYVMYNTTSVNQLANILNK